MKQMVKDGVIYIRGNEQEFAKVKGWRLMDWDKVNKWFFGKATKQLLEKLDESFGLVPPAREILDRYISIQAAVDHERTKPDPEVECFLQPPVKTSLYTHQKRAFNMALANFGVMPMRANARPGFGLLFEMGCGKTLTSVSIMGTMFQVGKIDKVLIVAPTSVVSVWPHELEKYSDFPYMVRTMLKDKKKCLEALEELEMYPAEALRIAVINYEKVWRDGIREALMEYDADLIICDESQRIKSHKAKQSKAMHELGDQARYKMILSGTPIQNNVTDIWSQYRFLDSSVFGKLYYPFERKYCVMHAVFKSKVVKTKNEDELTEKAHSIAFRVTKEEALDLPEQTFESRFVEMTPKERKIYIQLLRQSVAELGNEERVTAATVLTKLLRLQQLTGGFLVKDGEDMPEQVGTAKLDALKDIIEDYVIGANKKLVVFARFIAEVAAIMDLLNKMLPEGKKAVCIQGSVKKEDRGNIIDQFQTDDDTMVIVGQIDTLGVGVTLTAADTCVYYSKTYNYATYEQSLSRIHRIGQRNTCTYIDLICGGSVDEDITKSLEKKEDLAARIVDDWKEIFRA